MYSGTSVVVVVPQHVRAVDTLLTTCDQQLTNQRDVEKPARGRSEMHKNVYTDN